MLAASGLYGLISFLVVQREREIGVRLALGANRGQIVAMMLRHAMSWTFGGLAAALLLVALALARRLP